MEKPEDFGKVVGFEEGRPVHKNTKGDLIAGTPTFSFLDLMLRNHKGDEKLVRVPVDGEVLAFLQEK